MVSSISVFKNLCEASVNVAAVYCTSYSSQSTLLVVRLCYVSFMAGISKAGTLSSAGTGGGAEGGPG